MNKVSIATKPLVYSTFRYIANTTWNALAEYIDNSLQSFLVHKDVLSKINPGGKLRVEIFIDTDADKIVITDNAWGIEAENYQRAFELANIPLDASGLSEFGMGMKVSSIWFSDIWTVETCAYQERVKKTVKFDIKEVVDNQETSLNVVEKEAASTEHYTKITLSKLSQNKPKQLAAIKRHLSSTYTKFIREGILDLVINGELQTVSEPKILVAPYFRKVGGQITKEGDPQTWRIDISFAPAGSKYKVSGFIGVLETMSTDKDNGFLLFRRGRAIGYSGDEKYRPYPLCGQIGSPQYKRIFGELSVDGFNVSFQKNAFQEDEAFAAFIEDLADDLKTKIRRGELPDVFGQAFNYIKDRTPVETKKTAKTVVSSLAQELSKPIVASTEKTNNEKSSTTSPVPTTVVVPKEVQEAARVETKCSTTIDGERYDLIIRTKADGQKSGLYDLTKLPDGTYVSQINLSNRFFEGYDGNEDELKRIIYFIKVLITTEISMDSNGGAFRKYFNDYFGLI